MKKFLNPLPINQFAFEKIRSEQMIYVDKTQLIYNMVSNPDYYFLSRPRRFGKSLLVSILKHLYLGHKAYFKGLWIEKHTDWEWKEWPILIFDFNSISNGNENELKQGLHVALENNMNRYHIKLINTSIKEKFKEALISLNKKTNSKIIILVDEYDKPIIDHLDNEEQIQIAKKNRRVMKEFYGVLKDNEAGPMVEFLFITGVSKFSQVSVFSELNTLTDLTMDKNFATLLGYTQEELDTYFADWIDRWSKNSDLSPQAIKQQLKDRYNGFRFSMSETYVYNPISILNALKKRLFDNYWFDTATPTFLINILLNSEISIPEIEKARLPKTHFSSFEPDNINIIAIMFQTGYLTIKAVEWINKFDSLYAFDFPNSEVKEAFLELLMLSFAKIRNYDFIHKTIQKDLFNQRFQMVIDTIQQVFNRIPPMVSHNADFYHNFYYMMIRSACPSGRVIEIDNCILIFLEKNQQQIFINFSCQYSVEDMLRQIKVSGMMSSDCDVYKMAIHFNPAQRKIDEWDTEMPKPTLVEIPEHMEKTIKTIKIFLASSTELSPERQEMALLIQKENNQLIKKGKYLELVIWEDLFHSFQGERIQDYFNQKMLECDVVVVLIGSQVGAFTHEEFNLAWEHLNKEHQPKFLFVYVKDISISSQDRTALKNYTRVLDLIERIEQKEQLYQNYKDPVDLVYKFKNQLAYIIKIV